LAWAKQEALRHRYTFQAILSVPQGDVNPEQFCQAMQHGDEISDWRLMAHQDTQYRHAHVLFFRDKRLDQKTFLAWQTAVRQELSRLEQQHPSTALRARREKEVQPEMALEAAPKRVRQQEVIALTKVFNEPFSSSTNGSLARYLREPPSTECSIMCGSPVESAGGVGKTAANTLFSSSFVSDNSSAPVFTCR
jgi:hypothetical protein